MKLTSLSALKAGQQLAKGVKTQDGKILLPSATRLTNEFIRLLDQYSVTHVYIQDELSDDRRPCLKGETKIFALSVVAAAYQQIGSKKIIDTSRIKNASRKIILDVLGAMKNGSVLLANTYAVEDVRCLHAINTAIIVAALSLRNKYNSGQIEDFTTAALLHDIFLNKMSDDNDWRHAITTKTYLKDMKEYGVRTYMSIAMHHEKFDGTGPALYAGERIVEGARMIAVADAIDGLRFGFGEYQKTSPGTTLDALDKMAEHALDPAFVNNFKEIVRL